jgi:ABC-type cobalamin/Fe3+-siderophores transport system ATPase subunit
VHCGSLGLDARPNDAVVTLTCPHCGHEEERRRLAFFSITGPSGSGKTTLVRRLWRELPECVTLDGDLLWNGRFWNDRAGFYALWLTVAAQISQSGRPVVLCTAATPDDWNQAVPRPLVGDIHMLALVCTEEDLRSRLHVRARERDPESPADFLDQTCVFNRWLRERLPYVDTSTLEPDATAAQVAAWVRSRL